MSTSPHPRPGPPSFTLRGEIIATVTRLPLFLSSYVPFFVIAAIRFDKWTVRGICVGLAVLGVVALLIFWRRLSTASHHTTTVSNVREVGAEAGGYLASYVLPFVTVSQPTTPDMIGYGVFLAVLAVVYVRSDLIQVNPMFMLLLFRVVRVKLAANGGDTYLITRGVPRDGDDIDFARYSGIQVRVNVD